MPTTTAPSVRLFVTPSVPGVLQIPQLTAMTAQEVFDAASGDEVLAITRRAVSVGAPMICWQQAFHYADTGLNWGIGAIRYDYPAPSHFRLIDGGPAPTDPGPLIDWAPADRRWRQPNGQAVNAGVAYDVFWWPKVLRPPATTVFEWPLS